MTIEELKKKLVYGMGFKEWGGAIQYPPSAVDADGWIDLDKAEWVWITRRTRPDELHDGWNWMYVFPPDLDRMRERLAKLYEHDPTNLYSRAFHGDVEAWRAIGGEGEPPKRLDIATVELWLLNNWNEVSTGDLGFELDKENNRIRFLSVQTSAVPGTERNGSRERDQNIEIQIDRWVEAELKGNYRCPYCDRIMIVIASLASYAYCPYCERYFVPERQRIDFPKGDDP